MSQRITVTEAEFNPKLLGLTGTVIGDKSGFIAPLSIVELDEEHLSPELFEDGAGGDGRIYLYPWEYELEAA